MTRYLRKIVQTQLRIALGELRAKNIVLSKHRDPIKRKKYQSLSYQDLFNPQKHEMFFNDLNNLMYHNWDSCQFVGIFETDRKKCEARMVLINEIRKGDAHAALIGDSDMDSFRGAISWLDEKVGYYFGIAG